MDEQANPNADKAAEATILGSVLYSRDPNQAWALVSEHIEHPLMFYHRDHQLLALLITRLTNESQPIDGGTVADYAGRVRFDDAMESLTLLRQSDTQGGLRDARAASRTTSLLARGWTPDSEISPDDSVLMALGGYAGLSALGGSTTPRSQLTGLGRHVAGLYRRRHAIAAALRFQDAVRKPGSDPLALVDELQRSIAGSHGRSGSRTFRDAVQEIMQQNTSGHDIVAGRWGIPRLDELCPILSGSFNVVAGTPGSGKSSLALQAAIQTERYAMRQAEKAGQPGNRRSVLYITREMNRRDLAYIRLSKATGIPTMGLMRAKRSEDFLARIAAAADDWPEEGIRIQETMERMTVDDVCAAIRAEHQASGGELRAVIIDHLGRMDKSHPAQSQPDHYSALTNRLSNQCKHLDVGGIALAQFDKASRKVNRDQHGNVRNANPEPHVSDLYGSATIENDASSIILLHRLSDFVVRPGVTRVVAKIGKNRYGTDAEVALDFQGIGQTFTQSADPDAA